MVRSGVPPAVISNLAIGPALPGIEPAYHMWPWSRAVVQAATWVRVPSECTARNWQAMSTGICLASTSTAVPPCCRS